MSAGCPVCGSALLPDGRCATNPPPRLVRIPRKFYDDHEARGLLTPTAHRENSRHVWIDLDERSAVKELLFDARYYADGVGFDAQTQRTTCQAARALLAAVEADR